MGKRRRKGSRDYERFVALHHYMLRSPAWMTLSPPALKVLLHVWMRHNGTNNGTISYSVREAEEIGLSFATAARALRELVDRGFLVCTRASAFTVKNRNARLWRLTAEPSGNEPATKDFMRWQPAVDSVTSETGKFKTQCHPRHAQCHQRDCAPEIGTRIPHTVPPMTLSDPETTHPQCHPRHTSNIPGDTLSKSEPSGHDKPSHQPAANGSADANSTASTPESPPKPSSRKIARRAPRKSSRSKPSEAPP
jgi:hypothetical protein